MGFSFCWAFFLTGCRSDEISFYRDFFLLGFRSDGFSFYWAEALKIGWRRGVVVSGVRCMNEVNPRLARLVLGWVTVFGRVYHLGT